MDLTTTASPLEVAYSVGSLFNVLVFFVLLQFALRDASQVRALPADHPDRMIARAGIVNECVRLILLAGGELAISAAALVTPPVGGAPDTSPSVLAVVLFVVLMSWQFGLTLWGLYDLWFRHQLFNRMAHVRLICADTTYERCPFVQPSPLDAGSLLDPPLPPQGDPHADT